MRPDVLCVAVTDSMQSELAVRELVGDIAAADRPTELHLLHVSFSGVTAAELRKQAGTPLSSDAIVLRFWARFLRGPTPDLTDAMWYCGVTG